jgi:TIR domain
MDRDAQMNPSVFVSYRRDDSRDMVGRICDRLIKALGHENVFLDVDSIPLGVDFRRILREEVGQCHVLLAVIGPAWLNAADSAGRRRLDDPDDFVRIEVEAAVEQGTPVIPVLVRGSRLPPAEQLPNGLRKMSDCAAISLTADIDFHVDMERLLDVLRTVPVPCRELSARERFAVNIRRGRDWALAGAVLGLLYGLGSVLVRYPPHLSDGTRSVLAILELATLFAIAPIGGAMLGRRWARTKGAICGSFLALFLELSCSLIICGLWGTTFGMAARLNSWVPGSPIKVFWLGLTASYMAIAGVCIGGLGVATRTMARWPRSWPRRRRQLSLRISLGAILGAVLGFALGIGMAIGGYRTRFQDITGLLFAFPIWQFAILGAIGGFLDRRKQRS